MDRFFSKLDLRDIKIDPFKASYPPDAEDVVEAGVDYVTEDEVTVPSLDAARQPHTPAWAARAEEEPAPSGGNGYDDEDEGYGNGYATEAVAVNRALDKQSSTLALYERLKKDGRLVPAVRMVFGRDLLPLLVGERKYREALDVFADPMEYVAEGLKTAREYEKRAAEKAAAEQRAAEKAAAEQAAAEKRAAEKAAAEKAAAEKLAAEKAAAEKAAAEAAAAQPPRAALETNAAAPSTAPAGTCTWCASTMSPPARQMPLRASPQTASGIASASQRWLRNCRRAQPGSRAGT